MKESWVGYDPAIELPQGGNPVVVAIYTDAASAEVMKAQETAPVDWLQVESPLATGDRKRARVVDGALVIDPES